MFMLFKERFSLQPDQDFLKSHYRNLEKQYFDMKNLLEQRRFSSDETQQMVTVFDDVWDAYVKHDKDVLKSRFMNLRKRFNDMKTLLVQSGFTWNEMQQMLRAEDDVWDAYVKNKSSHVMTVIFKVVGEEDYQCPANNDPLRKNWTREMDCCFIDLMLEQLHRGIIRSVKKLDLKEYTDVTDILNHNGFAWDEIRQTMTADDDVWEAYIKEHPDAVTYRDKILDDYCDLCLIYDNESQNSRSSYFKFHTETSMKKHRRRKRKSAPSSTSACIQRVRRTIKKETQEAVEGKPCVVKTYLGTEEDKDYSSIECIAAALQTVPDMDDEIFLEACELLEDEREAKMFVAMDVTARRKWLLKKLRR
ncbi:uncharacterized protein LOC112039044 [Quercus suber]|uniref:uncharacterized protein LOC112039044 n=1 Tax=Quercus suber TaxID=58331 RepID=UPI0032DEB0FC